MASVGAGGPGSPQVPISAFHRHLEKPGSQGEPGPTEGQEWAWKQEAPLSPTESAGHLKP